MTRRVSRPRYPVASEQSRYCGVASSGIVELATSSGSVQGVFVSRGRNKESREDYEATRAVGGGPCWMRSGIPKTEGPSETWQADGSIDTFRSRCAALHKLPRKHRGRALSAVSRDRPAARRDAMWGAAFRMAPISAIPRCTSLMYTGYTALDASGLTGTIAVDMASECVTGYEGQNPIATTNPFFRERFH